MCDGNRNLENKGPFRFINLVRNRVARFGLPREVKSSGYYCPTIAVSLDDANEMQHNQYGQHDVTNNKDDVHCWTPFISSASPFETQGRAFYVSHMYLS
jgi:hypothetical protein